jgi:hypothetical protein
MKRLISFLISGAVLLCLSALPVFAQHGGGGAGGGAGMGHAGGMGGGAEMGQGSGMGQGGSMGQNRTMGRGSDMGPHASNPSMGNTPSSHSVSASSPTSLLSTNTKLASTLQDRLGSMLPSGMSLTDAASGFKNLGQFVASVHVSHNLDIPFSDLKSKMTDGDNLGKAIHELKPDANAKSEAKKANKEAKTDLKATPVQK